MTTKIIMLILIVLSGLEIFLGVFTLLMIRIISLFNKGFTFNEKTKAGIKIVAVVVFMISSVFFLFQAVKVLADWLDIPLDKGILDIFR